MVRYITFTPWKRKLHDLFHDDQDFLMIVVESLSYFIFELTKVFKRKESALNCLVILLFKQKPTIAERIPI